MSIPKPNKRPLKWETGVLYVPLGRDVDVSEPVRLNGVLYQIKVITGIESPTALKDFIIVHCVYRPVGIYTIEMPSNPLGYGNEVWR